MWKVCVNFVVLVFLFELANAENCANRQAFKVMARSEKDLQFLRQLESLGDELNTVIERAPRGINSAFIFSASDCDSEKVLKLMRRNEISNYESFNTKVEKSSAVGRRGNLPQPINDPEIVTTKYLSYDEMLAYIDFMSAKITKVNPEIEVVVSDEGQTFENRIVKSVKIGYRCKDNPVIIIDSGVHAREWHAKSLGLYTMAKLAEEADLGEAGILAKLTFVIIPSVNPDGNEYSQEHDIMWRKTRRPVDDGCIGVDGNRNYDANWDGGEYEKIPCSDVYQGPSPFSEVETQAVKNVIERYRERAKLYISIHTFGNQVMFPWGYTNDKHPRYDELLKVGQAAVDEVKAKTGAIFQTHPSAGLYVSPGGSDDYAIDKGGVPFSYTLELGAEDLNFAVPLPLLNKTLQEGWVAVRTMSLEVLKF